jgi:hemoglobin
MRTRLTLLLLAVAFALGACTVSPEPDPRGELYQALGERAGIQAIVEETLFRATEDTRIAHHFQGVDLGTVRDLISEQICELAGGPCEYSGRNMREAHQDLDISRADFNALVEHLIGAMERANVPVPAQNRLIAKLVPMHGDIVHGDG